VPEGAPAPEQPRDEFLGRYGAWFDPIPALIESTEPDAIEPTFTYDRPPRRTWGRGRVRLLGDAAHPMKPNIGQGAAQALEDAVVLGLCIGTNRDPENALRDYERRRVKRANAVVRASRRTGRAAEVRSPLAARLRDVVMKALPDRLTVARYAASLSSGRSATDVAHLSNMRRTRNGHIRNDTRDVSRRISGPSNGAICRRMCVACDRACTRVTLRNLHGKEGVDGSSPSEGLLLQELPANRPVLVSVQPLSVR
jgi:hypothetical protein